MADKKLFKSILNDTHSPIFLLDKKGFILWANEAFEKTYGYNFEKYNEKHSIAKQKYVKILGEIEVDFFKKNKELVIVKSIISKKNKKRWMQSNISVIKDNQGEIKEFIVVEADITQQKEIEEELAQQQENTQTLSEHLESVKIYIEAQIKELIEQKINIEKSKQQSEELLNKLLPYEIALQLKRKGYASPRNYKKVTVLQLNIRNFVELSEKLSIEQLIEQLEKILSKIDNVLEEHFVEKIKTSDSIYLGAGGVPLRNRSNPIDVVLASLKIKNIFNIINKGRKKENLPEFKISVGIHTGKAIAGIVGKNKLSYDIWGDAVNISSLVEKKSDIDKIIISEATKIAVEEYFVCEKVNQINLNKDKNINLYEVKKIKENYAFDKNGVFANELFLQELSRI